MFSININAGLTLCPSFTFWPAVYLSVTSLFQTPFPHVRHKGASSTFTLPESLALLGPSPPVSSRPRPSHPRAERCSSAPCVVLVRQRRTHCFVPPSSVCLSVSHLLKLLLLLALLLALLVSPLMVLMVMISVRTLTE